MQVYVRNLQEPNLGISSLWLEVQGLTLADALDFVCASVLIPWA